MIKYALVCERGHGFESWFPDSESYDVQARRRLIGCPECDSSRISKAIMAPAIGNARRSAGEAEPKVPVALLDERQQRLRAMARELRREIETHTDDVGAKFPEIARSIHEGETPPRAIRGQATAAEAEALIEEGVGVMPLPFLPEEFN
jgi:hypothetical protein